jgi:pimeloyl-ACP methyl ester carboxylesterase
MIPLQTQRSRYSLVNAPTEATPARTLAAMLALERAGEGEPLVLIHGVGTSRVVWRRAIPYLRDGREVIALDLPGFGGSPPCGPGFELDRVAEQVAGAAAEAAGGGFDLLGHSLGGAVAITVATARPELVRRLLLCAPAGFAPHSEPVARLGGALADPALRLRRAVGTPLAAIPLARRLALAGAVADGSRLSAADARTMLTASRGATRIGAAVSAAAVADLRAALESVRAPVGLLWGERDRIVPPRTIPEVGTYPLETIAAAGHVPQFERPESFAMAVERLIERLVTVS